ncbi:MAG: hypothetical protein ACFFC7_08040 [Candidatus Hermodarchaeota archaeon]
MKDKSGYRSRNRIQAINEPNNSESQRKRMLKRFKGRSETFFGVPKAIIQDIDELITELHQIVGGNIEKRVLSRFLAYGCFTIPPDNVPGSQGHEIISIICTACGECCREYDVTSEGQEEIPYTSSEYNPPCRHLIYDEKSDRFVCGIFHLERAPLCYNFQCLSLKILAIITGHNLIQIQQFLKTGLRTLYRISK